MSNLNQLKSDYDVCITNLVAAHLKLYSEYKNLSEEEYKCLNRQVVDAVMATNLSVMGSSGAQCQALVYEAMAHSLALILHNAGSAQFGAQKISQASIAKTCAAILKATE